ncbi:hypothetical protein JOY44_02055 [Phormidium sp. CLA17]|uniref:hypothetical protein n=1 Tax=Leptolyngbya sp. Cla-17 TaxID=2803751 RepID=UPI001933C471|nr:hypothetical protein [Leptolyngbya sp. Cla-17]MBM0740410.1 hypothetical protein [Leptolyngbya sp. Cla-17]
MRRAQILLKADIEGANWMDAQIAEAFDCRTKTVENICQRLVERGLEETLNGVGRSTPPTEKLLNGEQEAHIVALRLAYIGTFQSTATHGRKGQEIALW